jgi:hypothetical protein
MSLVGIIGGEANPGRIREEHKDGLRQRGHQRGQSQHVIEEEQDQEAQGRVG